MSRAQKVVPLVALALSGALHVAAWITTVTGAYMGAAMDAASIGFSATLLSFPLVGLLLVRRMPQNPIGWIFCALGVAWALQLFGSWQVENRVLEEGASDTLADLAVWVTAWSTPIAFGTTATFLPLLFPTGSVLSPRWRLVGWAAAFGITSLGISYALSEGALEDYPAVSNPYGLEGTAELFDVVTGVGWLLLSVTVVLSVVSLIVRFRRSRGIQRQQMKWMVFAGGLLIAANASWFASPVAGMWLSGLALAAIPVATAFAILRYRLYEIDLIINRALVYALLSAVLAGAYILLVTVASTVIGESNLSVAAATLAVAALFQPVRRWIQAFIDRRFYRSKYDASQTIEMFSNRLRDEVDLETLRLDLTGVVAETMQPRFVSLWLRPSVDRSQP